MLIATYMILVCVEFILLFLVSIATMETEDDLTPQDIRTLLIMSVTLVMPIIVMLTFITKGKTQQRLIDLLTFFDRGTTR